MADDHDEPEQPKAADGTEAVDPAAGPNFLGNPQQDGSFDFPIWINLVR